MPEWMKPQGDPLVEARRSRDRAEGLRALPEAYRTGRAKPPEGPLGQPQAWAQQPVPATSDDGVKPH